MKHQLVLQAALAGVIAVGACGMAQAGQSKVDKDTGECKRVPKGACADLGGLSAGLAGLA